MKRELPERNQATCKEVGEMREAANMSNSLAKKPVLVYIEDEQAAKTEAKELETKVDVPSWRIAAAIAGRAATFGRYTY